MDKTVLKTWEVQQLQFIDEVIDTSVVAQRHIPMVQSIQKTFRDFTVVVHRQGDRWSCWAG